jgi:hypothetical protein
LLRYKENESTLELVPREKIMGVDYNIIDVTDKQGRKNPFLYQRQNLSRDDAFVHRRGR